MEKTNKLPKSWCVTNDGSQLFKDTVVVYLNSLLPENPIDSFLGFQQGRYGVNKDGNPTWEVSTMNFDKCLTLSEFIELTKPDNSAQSLKGQDLIRCTCECHTNPAVMHAFPCCDNGWVEKKRFDVFKEPTEKPDLAGLMGKKPWCQCKHEIQHGLPRTKHCLVECPDEEDLFKSEA